MKNVLAAAVVVILATVLAYADGCVWFDSNSRQAQLAVPTSCAKLKKSESMFTVAPSSGTPIFVSVPASISSILSGKIPLNSLILSADNASITQNVTVCAVQSIPIH